MVVVGKFLNAVKVAQRSALHRLIKNTIKPSKIGVGEGGVRWAMSEPAGLGAHVVESLNRAEPAGSTTSITSSRSSSGENKAQQRKTV